MISIIYVFGEKRVSEDCDSERSRIVSGFLFTLKLREE
jgi:hypothetical protein